MVNGVVDEIIDKTCEVWNVRKEELFSRERKLPLPFVRAIISYNLYHRAELKKVKIAEILGRNHSSVIYFLKMYDSMYDTNKEFRAKADLVKYGLKDESTWNKITRFLKELTCGVCGDGE